MWVNEVREKLSISNPVFYTAVSIMDYVLNQNAFPPAKYQAIALTSLIISSKYEELDKKIPMIDDYIRVSRFMYPSSLISDIEAIILKILDYDLKIPHS